jgi:hypothetical protein
LFLTDYAPKFLTFKGAPFFAGFAANQPDNSDRLALAAKPNLHETGKIEPGN